MLNILLATEAAETTTGGASWTGYIGTFVMIAAMVAIFYFLLYADNRHILDWKRMLIIIDRASAHVSCMASGSDYSSSDSLNRLISLYCFEIRTIVDRVSQNRTYVSIPERISAFYRIIYYI